MKKFSLCVTLITVSFFISMNSVFAADAVPVKSVTPVTVPIQTKMDNDRADAVSPDQDSKAAVNKVLYDMCVQGMNEGLREGKQKAAKADEQGNDSVTQADMSVMAEKVCACAAPKLRAALLNDDETAKTESAEKMAEIAKNAIMTCM